MTPRPPPNPAPTPDGTGLITLDPWLAPFAPVLKARYAAFQRTLRSITQHEGSLAAFATGHQRLGFTRGTHETSPRRAQPGIWYREWAPGAEALSLIGDFNNWDRAATPLTRDQFGTWSVFLPEGRLEHDAPVKVHVRSSTSAGAGAGAMDRIPAYIRRVTFNQDGSNATGRVWLPPPFQWKHAAPKPTPSLRIYEAHTGMAQEDERVGTFVEFRDRILPRIAEAGYNCIQLMAVQEHPYYGSFGYHVSNFFAVSSRFGTPEDFKSLVDAAHALNLRVLLDLVHSHSVKNTVEGLGWLDGTDHQYFHAGPRGMHPAWDSLLFDYSKPEVLRFLLSNVRYWLEEFKVDGFRFDGVTSMLYLDHGLGRTFSSYDDYFGSNVDPDALTYLQLANRLIKETNPHAISVAEDVSGMAGIARPLDDGGLGFDYRLAMGIPDYWIKTLKERTDEHWSVGEIFHTLSNRRHAEPHIAYAESHDQALVGDKTLAFRLMDAEMYWHMNKAASTPVIDRGVALHKLIRLATFFIGGEGWLNFMGNEFGHPEWVDFPREGNGYSYKHARRQWSLAENGLLRYEDLAAFDLALMKLDERFRLLAAPPARLLNADELPKRLIAERAGLVLAINFNPTHSFADCRIGVPAPTDYQSVLDTDSPAFGGHGRTTPDQRFPWHPTHWDTCDQSVQIYLPARAALVLAPHYS